MPGAYLSPPVLTSSALRLPLAIVLNWVILAGSLALTYGSLSHPMYWGDLDGVRTFACLRVFA